MEPVEIEAKTLIQKSKTPSNDYVINPYTGCVLGCAYCFASFAGRQFGRSVKEWGDYLYVKKNAVELAREELARMPELKRRGTMLLSSVTDPYQGHETKYRLTRGILRELTGIGYPGLVRILTKSPIVTRDIDLLTSLPRAEVGMTVTTADDKVSRRLEVRAPLASRRLRTLAELREAGIPAFAFVGPLLPHFAARPELLDHLFGQLADAGVTEVFMEHVNLKRYIRERRQHRHAASAGAAFPVVLHVGEQVLHDAGAARVEDEAVGAMDQRADGVGDGARAAAVFHLAVRHEVHRPGRAVGRVEAVGEVGAEVLVPRVEDDDGRGPEWPGAGSVMVRSRGE